MALIGINLLGLAISGSTSALAMFAAGLFTMGIFAGNWQRFVLVGVASLAVLLGGSLAALFPSQFWLIADEVAYRLDPTDKLLGDSPQNFGERVAFQLDVFDASALLFLLNEPQYALSGTGPGLVSLPASYYVPPGVASLVWNEDVGIDSLPGHGLLLEISNSGLLGLGCWLSQFWWCTAALRRVAGSSTDRRLAETWRVGLYMYLLGAAMYCVQVSISPVWAVLSAVGWAGGLLQCNTQRRWNKSRMKIANPLLASRSTHVSAPHSLRRAHA
jgi:hypothetical protein